MKKLLAGLCIGLLVAVPSCCGRKCRKKQNKADTAAKHVSNEATEYETLALREEQPDTQESVAKF